MLRPYVFFECIRIRERIIYVGVVVLIATAIRVIIDRIRTSAIGRDGLRSRISCSLDRIAATVRIYLHSDRLCREPAALVRQHFGHSAAVHSELRYALLPFRHLLPLEWTPQ
jgi:hypothetical protein